MRILEAWDIQIRVPHRAPVRDDLHAREVHPRRRLDARARERSRCARSAGVTDTTGRAGVDPRRGRAVGDLRRDRLRREPGLGTRRRTRRCCRSSGSRSPGASTASARVPPAGRETAATVRRGDDRTGAVLPDDHAAHLLLRHVADRGRGGLLHAAQPRHRRRARDDSVPRWSLGGRSDRRGARGVRAVGPRRAGGIDVRPTARGHDRPALLSA